MHVNYDVVLTGLERDSGVSRANLGQVLGHVMKARDPIPRTRLAADLDLSQGTVSKAVKELLSAGLLTADRARSDGPGRPIIPLRLGDDAWALVGVKIGHRLGCPAVLTGVVTTLNGENVLAQDGWELSDGDSTTQDALVDQITELVTSLIKKSRRSRRRGSKAALRILGVGVELGGHVHDDRVIYSTNNHWSDFPLGERLTRALRFPTVVENDVNALALHEVWKGRYTEPDFAVVAVFDEGIGCGLVRGGSVYRGGHGMAGELGHVTVEYLDSPPPRRAPRPRAGFDEPCPCEGWGHVDSLATPSRICGELEASDIVAAASTPATNQKVAAVFRRAGRALGRGIATLLLLDNPSRLLVRLPTALATAAPGTAGAEYITAAKEAIHEGGFSTAVADAHLDETTAWEALDEEGAAIEGATAAAVRVLDHFLEHATDAGCGGSRAA